MKAIATTRTAQLVEGGTKTSHSPSTSSADTLLRTAWVIQTANTHSNGFMPNFEITMTLDTCSPPQMGVCCWNEVNNG